MDECLPLGSLDASTLQKLLTQERTRREELEQDVQELQTLVRGLTERNTLLRQQVAMLQTENARLHCRK